MEIEPWVHFAHVLSATIWVGGGLALSVMGFRLRRNADVARLLDFGSTLQYLGLRVLMPAVIAVLLTGVWLVADEGGDFTKLWVVIALVDFAVAFLIGVLFLSRAAGKLARATDGGDLPGAQAALRGWLGGYWIVLAILVFTIWDMVAKPGA